MIQRLFKDTLVYGVSAIFSRGLSLISLPIYARILAPADYGALDMFMVIGTLANLVITLEINQALSRFLHEETSERRRVMASTALWFAVAAYVAALAAALVASDWLCRQLLGNLRYLSAFRLSLCVISLNGVFYILQSQLRFELLSKEYAKVSVVYALSTLVFGVLLGKLLGFGLEGIIFSQLIAAMLGSVLSFSRLPGRYGFLFDGGRLRSMLAFSLPLVPSALATFFTLYANRIMLNTLASLDSVGMFGIGARIAGSVGLLIVGLQAALTPLIYTYYKEPETPARLARIVHGFVAGAFTCCLALGLFAPEILSILVPSEYREAANLVLMLSLATLLSQMYIFFPGIAISKRTVLQLGIFAATALFGLAVNWVLVSFWEAFGAALATLLSSTLFISLWIAVSQRLYPLPLRIGRLVTAALLVLVAGLFEACIQAHMAPGWVLLVAKAGLVVVFAACTVVAGLISREDLQIIFGKVTSRLGF